MKTRICGYVLLAGFITSLGTLNALGVEDDTDCPPVLAAPISASEKQTPKEQAVPAVSDIVEPVPAKRKSEVSVSLKTGTGIQERDIVNESAVFSANVPAVYCWMYAVGVLDSTTIVHVWKFNNEEIARVPLQVRGPAWRTWSRKTMMPEWKGSWTVEAQQEDGTVLAVAAFRLADDISSGEDVIVSPAAESNTR